MTSAPLHISPPQTRPWAPTLTPNASGATTAGTALPTTVVDTAPHADFRRSILAMPLLRQIRNALAVASQVEDSEAGFRPGTNDAYRTALCEFFHTTPSTILPALFHELARESPSIRAATVRYVAEILFDDTASQAWRYVLPLLHDSDPEVRDAAATALIDLHSPFAVPHLRTALESEPSPSVAETMRQTLFFLQQIPASI